MGARYGTTAVDENCDDDSDDEVRIRNLGAHRELNAQHEQEGADKLDEDFVDDGFEIG